MHVNHGLMRKGESEQVVDVFENQMDANLVYVDATDRFLDKLVDVDEPEAKRKIIGAEFVRVFEEEARKVGNAVFRMKEWWSYARCSFADPQSVHRAVRKLRRADEYEAAVRQIFATELLADEPRYS